MSGCKCVLCKPLYNATPQALSRIIPRLAYCTISKEHDLVGFRKNLLTFVIIHRNINRRTLPMILQAVFSLFLSQNSSP